MSEMNRQPTWSRRFGQLATDVSECHRRTNGRPPMWPRGTGELSPIHPAALIPSSGQTHTLPADRHTHATGDWSAVTVSARYRLLPIRSAAPPPPPAVSDRAGTAGHQPGPVAAAATDAARRPRWRRSAATIGAARRLSARRHVSAPSAAAVTPRRPDGRPLPGSHPVGIRFIKLKASSAVGASYEIK